MRSFLITGILFIFFIQSAISQPTQTIRGKVVDQESQIPLVGANIIILEAGPITGVITDQEGSFIIEEIPVSRYNLLFCYVGYESFIMREVVVGTAKEAFLDVGMRELVYEMDEGLQIYHRPIISCKKWFRTDLCLKREERFLN